MSSLIDWPESLPQRPNRQGFQYAPQSGVIETDMDAGFPKIRRRFTATYADFTLTFTMTPAQVNTFEAFYRNSPDSMTLSGIGGGVWTFNIINPFGEPGSTDTITVRMVGTHTPYTIVPDGDTTDFNVSFSVRRLP